MQDLRNAHWYKILRSESMSNDKEIKSCETCKYRGNAIGNSDWLYWCEAKKNCVDGSGWEKKSQ